MSHTTVSAIPGATDKYEKNEPNLVDASVQTMLSLDYFETIDLIDPIDEGPNDLTDDSLYRKKVLLLLNSTKFMMGIIILVIVDIILIITELFLELAFLKKGVEYPEDIEVLFLIISLAVLTIFIFEIILRVYIMGLGLFTNFLEALDALIIIVSFFIDLYSLLGHNRDLIGANLIILFRLWRTSRLITGFINSLKRQATIKAGQDRKYRKELNENLEKQHNLATWQKSRIVYLLEIFLALSLMILSLFIIEILLRIYAMGLEFFKHFLEMFDAMVILISLVLDLYTLSQEHKQLMGVDLIILFRLWRVTRLFSGFVSSLKRQSEIKNWTEDRLRSSIIDSIEKCQQACELQDAKILLLTSVLDENHIQYKPESFSSDS